MGGVGEPVRTANLIKGPQRVEPGVRVGSLAFENRDVGPETCRAGESLSLSQKLLQIITAFQRTCVTGRGTTNKSIRPVAGVPWRHPSGQGVKSKK